MSEIDALYADDDETGAAPPVSDEPADVPPEEQTTGNAPATTGAADDGEELTPEETAYAEKLIQALGGVASASDDPTPAASEADQEMVAESVKTMLNPYLLGGTIHQKPACENMKNLH